MSRFVYIISTLAVFSSLSLAQTADKPQDASSKSNTAVKTTAATTTGTGATAAKTPTTAPKLPAASSQKPATKASASATQQAAQIAPKPAPQAYSPKVQLPTVYIPPPIRPFEVKPLIVPEYLEVMERLRQVEPLRFMPASPIPYQPFLLPPIKKVEAVKYSNSFTCEQEAAAAQERTRQERALRSAEIDLSLASSQLSLLRSQHATALSSAQSAEQSASSLANNASQQKGVFGWISAIGSIAGTINGLDYRSQARNLESQISLVESRVRLAQSGVELARSQLSYSSLTNYLPSVDCSNTEQEQKDHLSPNVLQALKSLGVKCVQGGQLKTILNSLEPGSLTQQSPLIPLHHGDSIQKGPASASIEGIAQLADIRAALYSHDKRDTIVIGFAASETARLSPDE